MNSRKQMADLLADWRYIRSQSTDFIEALGDAGLQQKLPRPGLDTFAKHFQEMIDVQTAYITAVTTGEMDFSNIAENDAYEGKETAGQLLARMQEADRAAGRGLPRRSRRGGEHTVAGGGGRKVWPPTWPISSCTKPFIWGNWSACAMPRRFRFRRAW